MGSWHNGLGSGLTISKAENGHLEGHYESAVGDATCMYKMSGTYDMEGKSLGWVVTWVNDYGTSYSTTSWSGQYQDDVNKPEISATWLLTEQTSPGLDWYSTHVGFGNFTQCTEINENASKRAPFSHPKTATSSHRLAEY